MYVTMATYLVGGADNRCVGKSFINAEVKTVSYGRLASYIQHSSGDLYKAI